MEQYYTNEKLEHVIINGEERLIDGKVVEYIIGNYIVVHSSDKNPDSWFLTARILDIYEMEICSKKCNKKEISNYICLNLLRKQNIMNEIVSDALEFEQKIKNILKVDTK